MYALLVNLTKPPMRFKNFVHGSEQTIVKSLGSLQVPPSSTTKPLYSADNEASKICGLLFALATLFAMRM